MVEMSEMAGKRKIFISAHPADRYEYLGVIADAINETGSCEAVYNPVPNDKGPFLPEGTDTVVVIASLKYFVWANSGYASEYFAAIREGVKIIPFLIESTQNVIDLVNMRCGKLQYIDATVDLGFALDTLRAHLTTEERVVDESLPSVFISYRRADRELLHTLVGSLKESPAYKNVNIWYDEVIAPGENYSSSIMRQLRNCNLFILLVTPNILEPSNYVWRVEYKTAKDMRKRIFAIEGAKTDKQSLARMYGNLGRMADIKHKGALHSVISEIASLRKAQKYMDDK